MSQSSLLKLFFSLVVTHKGPKKTLPWKGFRSVDDAKKIIDGFLALGGKHVTWEPVGGRDTNAAQIMLSSDPGLALIERITNAIDAVLELWRQQNHKEGTALPESPREAVEKWGKVPGSKKAIPENALAGELSDNEVDKLARATVLVRHWAGAKKDPHGDIVDIRDYGIGISAADFIGTILSLNVGNKLMKLYLSGQFGQGGAASFRFGMYTVVVSRVAGSNKVAFTIVKEIYPDGTKQAQWVYMLIDGKIPEVTVDEDVFPPGTLIRHIGYDMTGYRRKFGHGSVDSLINERMADPVLPIRRESYKISGKMVKTKDEGSSTRTAIGSANKLRRGAGSKKTGRKADSVEYQGGFSDTLGKDVVANIRGAEDLGEISVEYFVLKRKFEKDGSERDVLASYTKTTEPVVLSINGQVQGVQRRAFISKDAKLPFLAKHLYVHISCSNLTPPAISNTFTATRENFVKGLVIDKIMEKVLDWWAEDDDLKRLNLEYMGADLKKMPESKFKERLKKLTKFLKGKSRGVEPHKDGKDWGWRYTAGGGGEGPGGIPEIEIKDPPTILEWVAEGPLRIAPGETKSVTFRTDADPEVYWHSSDRSKSKIRVGTKPPNKSSHMVMGPVKETGRGMIRKTGRATVKVTCSDKATIGDEHSLVVQCKLPDGTWLEALREVKVVKLSKCSPGTGGTTTGGGTDGTSGGTGDKGGSVGGKVIKGKFTDKAVGAPNFTIEGIDRTHTMWSTLDWPADPDKETEPSWAWIMEPDPVNNGFGFRVYYNVKFGPFADEMGRAIKPTREAYKDIYEEELLRYAALDFSQAQEAASATADSNLTTIKGLTMPEADDIRDEIGRTMDLIATNAAYHATELLKLHKKLKGDPAATGTDD